MSSIMGSQNPVSPSGDTDETLVSVVMPCLNEALTVELCVKKAMDTLSRLQVPGEVIVADNGSVDGSPALAARMGARVVHVKDRGYGAALQAGIAAARGRFIVMADADDSYDFGSIGAFIDSLRDGSEMVVGNRFWGGIVPGAMPWLHRYIGNPALSGILNLFFRTPVGDAHCGLRAFRKDSYQRLALTSPGMEFASEMVIKAHLNRLRIAEVPVVLHPDGRNRPPHLRTFRDGWRHLRLLLLLCPTWLYLIPGCAMMVLGFATMAALTAGPLRIGVALDLHAMLLGALSAILGYQTLWLGACAQCYGRASGILPRDAALAGFFDAWTLERGLLAGAVLLVLASVVILACTWRAHDLGPAEILGTMRHSLWGLCLLVLGVQTGYGSFFLAMIEMGSSPRRR